jgi:hypothetical protein
MDSSSRNLSMDAADRQGKMKHLDDTDLTCPSFLVVVRIQLSSMAK